MPTIPLAFVRSLCAPTESKRAAQKLPEIFFALLSAAGLFLLSGCSSATMTNPARSVTEQLLLSTAADRAIKTVPLGAFDGKRVFVDGAYFDSYDSKYVLGAIRDALSSSGALLMPSITNSEIVVEPRSGGLSTDFSDSLLGVPQTGLPIPLTGVLQIPELALYKATHQNSIAKFALLAYATDSHEHVFSSGPMVGKSFNTYYKFLGLIQWNSTDIPEKLDQKKKK